MPDYFLAGTRQPAESPGSARSQPRNGPAHVRLCEIQVVVFCTLVFVLIKNKSRYDVLISKL